MKADASIRTPARYLASLPEPRRAELRTLHAAIRAAAPGVKPFIVHGMLGYGPRHYRHASGREGDTAVICLASQKNHISLYLCGCDDHGHPGGRLGPRLGKVSVGKGCIRFRKIEDVDLSVLAEIVRAAAAWAEEQP